VGHFHWLPRYNWNIVESGIKHHRHKPNPLYQTKYLNIFLNCTLIYIYRNINSVEETKRKLLTCPRSLINLILYQVHLPLSGIQTHKFNGVMYITQRYWYIWWVTYIYKSFICAFRWQFICAIVGRRWGLWGLHVHVAICWWTISQTLHYYRYEVTTFWIHSFTIDYLTPLTLAWKSFGCIFFFL
jgi:hypothetical protein